jgi:hypothetical protein
LLRKSWKSGQNSNLDPYGLPGPLPRDQDFRIHGHQRIESPGAKPAARRALDTKRDAKKVPGHHLQIDVKTVKWYQYPAIDDATRMRTLQIFPKHNQDGAIKFMD